MNPAYGLRLVIISYNRSQHYACFLYYCSKLRKPLFHPHILLLLCTQPKVAVCRRPLIIESLGRYSPVEHASFTPAHSDPLFSWEIQHKEWMFLGFTYAEKSAWTAVPVPTVLPPSEVLFRNGPDSSLFIAHVYQMFAYKDSKKPSIGIPKYTGTYGYVCDNLAYPEI